MHPKPERHNALDSHILRREAGMWLKEQREACGLSQRELADAIGLDCYTLISQLELGCGRIPPNKYRIWAAALKMPVRDFALALLPYYDPDIYEAIYTAAGSDQSSN